jgi:type I restriction enzyme, S subunit
MQNRAQLPKDWKWSKLGEVADYLNGRAFKPTEWKNSGKPIIRIQNLNKPEANYNYTEDEFEERYKVLTGDLLFAWSASLGAYVWKGNEAWLNQHIFKVVPNEGTDKMYLYYMLEKIVQELYAKAHGSGMVHVTKGKFEATEIPYPSKPIQQQIVSKIEELFSELDKSIEELKTAQQQLKVYRQAVLKWAFEGKLTNENVKDGELPVGWKLVKIQELAESNKHALKAGPFGSSLKKEFYTATGYKIYGQEQVINDDAFFGDYYVNEEKYQELSSCRIKPFDILISLVGTVGKVLLLPENCQPGIINPRLIKISLNTEIYLPKFFKYYFESAAVKSFYGAETRGTTMDVLNLGIIKTIPFPLCSIEEQQQIVQEIESRLSVCDKIEETITNSLKQAEALRQSILKKAFEGKLM